MDNKTKHNKIKELNSHERGFGHFIGTSKAMQDVYEKIAKLATTDIPILIEGESGTGKEICAQSLHYYSDRKDNPFIALNCAALPDTLIESTLFGHVKGAFTGAINARDGAIARAEKGTLFLDEIGDLSLNLQVKLLRFCQEFTYSKLGSDTILKANIRLVCASNKTLKQLVKSKEFREDLYYRLHIAPITMPPLRARGGDILDIAYYYLDLYTTEQNKEIREFSNNVEQILAEYHWPGNVRELQNTIQQIVAFENTPIILASMLPKVLTQGSLEPSKYTKEDKPIATIPLWKIEKRAIQEAISLAGGNIPKAAAMLDVAPSTLYRKIHLWNKN